MAISDKPVQDLTRNELEYAASKIKADNAAAHPEGGGERTDYAADDDRTRWAKIRAEEATPEGQQNIEDENRIKAKVLYGVTVPIMRPGLQTLDPIPPKRPMTKDDFGTGMSDEEEEQKREEELKKKEQEYEAELKKKDFQAWLKYHNSKKLIQAEIDSTKLGQEDLKPLPTNKAEAPGKPEAKQGNPQPTVQGMESAAQEEQAAWDAEHPQRAAVRSDNDGRTVYEAFSGGAPSEGDVQVTGKGNEYLVYRNGKWQKVDKKAGEEAIAAFYQNHEHEIGGATTVLPKSSFGEAKPIADMTAEEKSAAFDAELQKLQSDTSLSEDDFNARLAALRTKYGYGEDGLPLDNANTVQDPTDGAAQQGGENSNATVQAPPTVQDPTQAGDGAAGGTTEVKTETNPENAAATNKVETFSDENSNQNQSTNNNGTPSPFNENPLDENGKKQGSWFQKEVGYDDEAEKTELPRSIQSADWKETVESIKSNPDLTDAQKNAMLVQARKDYGVDDEMWQKATNETLANLITEKGAQIQKAADGKYYEVIDGVKKPVLTEKDGERYACIQGTYYKLNNATGQWEQYQRSYPPLPDEIAQGLNSDDPAVRRDAEKKQKKWEKEQDDNMREEMLLLDIYRGIDNGKVGDGDTLRTWIGDADLLFLQKRMGLGMFSDISGDKLMRKLLAQRTTDNAIQLAANGELEEALRSGEVKGDKESKSVTTDGQPVRYTQEARNKFLSLFKKYGLDNDTDIMKFLRSDAGTKLFQDKAIYDIIQESGLYKTEEFKRLFPSDIDKDGNLVRNNVDGHLGNKTIAQIAYLLGEFLSPEEMNLKMGIQINPNSGELEPWEPTEFIEDIVSKEQVETELDFEKRRNERQKKLAAIGSLIMTIGDTIGTSAGLKAADRSEINKVQDELEKKYYEVTKDYNERLDKMREERQKARSEREAQQFAVYEATLKHNMDKEMAAINNAYNAAEKEKDRNFQSTENEKNRALQKKMNDDNNALRKAEMDLKNKAKEAERAGQATDTIYLAGKAFQIAKGTRTNYTQNIAGKISSSELGGIIKVPVTDATGNILKDDKGNPKTETLQVALDKMQNMDADTKTNAIWNLFGRLGEYNTENNMNALYSIILSAASDTYTPTVSTDSDSSSSDSSSADSSSSNGKKANPMK